MFTKTKIAIAASVLALSGVATAGDLYIDVGDNSYELSPPNIADANSTTGVFQQFGFNQLLATSVYDFSDGSVFGSFYDTNVPSELAALGIPTGGTAIDGSTPVNLSLPTGAQSDIDALSPLVPPANTDSEGFGLTWDLQVQYRFDGVLTPGGPIYTGGFFNVFFNDFNDDTNDRQVLGGELTGSNISLGNLDLFFDLTFAEAGFLFVENEFGDFVDAAAGIPDGNFVDLTLDTNVNPPIPTADQLLLLADGNNNNNPVVVRQSELDGSIVAKIPVPGPLALLGLGLVGLGLARRKASA